MIIQNKKYCVYIVTNFTKTVLYTGMTNVLGQRIIEHYLQRGNPSVFAGRYHAFYLIYYKFFDYVNDAIAFEKEIKDWNRKRKELLITSFNPEWKFLNEELFEKWPPDNISHRKDSYKKTDPT